MENIKETSKKEKQNKNKGLWIGGIIVLAIIAIGGLLYFTNIIPKGSFDFITKNLTNKSEEIEKEKVAAVNSKIISEGELEARLEQLKVQTQTTSSITDQQKRQVLQEMIDEELLYQKAKQEGASTDSQEVEKQYQQTKNQFQNQENFQKALQENNLTEEDLKSNIERGIVLNQYIEQIRQERDLEVTEEEIQNFYDQNIAKQEGAPELKELKEQIKQELEQQKISGIIDQILSDFKEKSDIQTFL